MSFKQAVKNAMKGGKMNKKQASAAVAEASRNASPEAKRKNPNLKKVKGGDTRGDGEFKGFGKAAARAKMNAKRKGKK